MEGHIPRGLLTVLGASQGSGKSFVALDLARSIIHNLGFPDNAPIARPGANVIYVDAEAVPQILRERASHYNMDQTKIFLMLADHGEMIDLGQQRYQDRLTEMTAYLKPELIIIDSLSSIHSRGQNNVEDLRALVGYLIRLAGWGNCGMLLIHHIRKTPNGQRMMNAEFGMEDLSGSGYITQQARVVMGLRVVQTGPEFDPNETVEKPLVLKMFKKTSHNRLKNSQNIVKCCSEHQKRDAFQHFSPTFQKLFLIGDLFDSFNGPRELKVLKSNLGAYPKPLGFIFEPLFPEGARLKWKDQAPKEYREPSQSDLCREWLEDTLKENPEGLHPKEVLKMGVEQGFSRSMIFRARRELIVHISNTRGRQAPDNAWRWSDVPLPQDDTMEDEE